MLNLLPSGLQVIYDFLKAVCNLHLRPEHRRNLIFSTYHHNSLKEKAFYLFLTEILLIRLSDMERPFR